MSDPVEALKYAVPIACNVPNTESTGVGVVEHTAGDAHNSYDAIAAAAMLLLLTGAILRRQQRGWLAAADDT